MLNENIAIAKLVKDPKTKANQINTVIAHCSDAGAMAYALFSCEPKRMQLRIAFGLGINVQSAQAWFAYIAGLHDLLKYSWAFQLLNGICDALKEIAPDAFDPGLKRKIDKLKSTRQGEVSPVQHAILLSVVLPRLLNQTTGLNESIARQLTYAPEAHHALYVSAESFQRAEKYLTNARYREAEFLPLQEALTQHLWSELAFDGIQFPQHVTFEATTRMASLIQQSDHIASRPNRFPLQNGICRPFSETTEMAQQVLQSYGISQPVPHERHSFSNYGLQARPVQLLVENLSLTGTYCLFVKAATGIGKTALAIQVANQGEGFIFAANSQTTANATYEQIVPLLAKVETNVSQAVGLAHSNRNNALENYLENIASDPEAFGYENIPTDVSAYELQKEGITDAITSKYVVCTIDQLLMSMFNNGKQVFRSHFVTKKPIIIDEIHSLDGRLDALLMVFLQYLGKFQVPVIMLSATIASQKFNQFTSAWCKGAGIRHNPVTLHSDDQIIHIQK